jgi:hypothetical protein
VDVNPIVVYSLLRGDHERGCLEREPALVSLSRKRDAGGHEPAGDPTPAPFRADTEHSEVRLVRCQGVGRARRDARVELERCRPRDHTADEGYQHRGSIGPRPDVGNPRQVRLES